MRRGERTSAGGSGAAEPAALRSGDRRDVVAKLGSRAEAATIISSTPSRIRSRVDEVRRHGRRGHGSRGGGARQLSRADGLRRRRLRSRRRPPPDRTPTSRRLRDETLRRRTRRRPRRGTTTASTPPTSAAGTLALRITASRRRLRCGRAAHPPGDCARIAPEAVFAADARQLRGRVARSAGGGSSISSPRKTASFPCAISRCTCGCSNTCAACTRRCR